MRPAGQVEDQAYLTVHHDGTFKAGTIDGSVNKKDAVRFTANGDYANDGVEPNDTFEVTTLDLSTGTYAKNVGRLTVSNYAAVSIGSLDMKPGRNGPGGRVTITNISGDVTIDSDLDEPNLATISEGVLCLGVYIGTTDGGNITVTNVDVATAEHFTFDADADNFGFTYVNGTLSNFDTNSASGNGTAADPYVTSQTVLRASTNEYIVYDPDLNGYLATNAYKVAAPDGTAGSGGLLVTEDMLPEPPPMAPVIVIE
jgi:hypothetical protein